MHIGQTDRNTLKEKQLLLIYPSILSDEKESKCSHIEGTTLSEVRQIPSSSACHNENRTVGVISGTSFWK